ncbi:MAG: hypothetical protein IGS39_07305 [Calothrix sp. C42_A2020_038]|nr:hypothetical protein [Calothrix sp. C42_A2020_038]
MLAILTENQIFTPGQVCQSCMLADASGQPRWHGGQLYCGRAIGKLTDKQPEQYQCVMGFRVIKVE